LIWLVLSVLSAFLFGQLFKYSQRQGCQAPIVVTTNYLVLGLALLGYYLGAGGLVLTGPILKIGAATGIAFIVSLLVMTRAMEIADVAGVLTAFRLSILVPIAVSVIVWGVDITPWQVVGIILAGAALFCMTRRDRPPDSVVASSHLTSLSGNRALGLLAAIFLLQGVGHSCINWIHHDGLDRQRMLVLLVVAFTAGGSGSLVILLKRYKPRRKDLVMGTAIGLFNLGALGIMLTALATVPSTVFWSVQGCAVVMMDNFFAQFVWREPLSKPAKIGACLGALSMLLVL
jgi:hypothetical protein